ncbi:IS3 family transposase [Mycoplasmopsis anatis]|uniref:IS3 family transposase n=1 Tax=Mycoplasmopsis anatis TaxID=171279 RepID=UPI001C4E2B32|nr:IS3 family transposase [Mycoplasmopsis anatis]
MNGRTSYSRIGNSLDNREAEYWFSVLKTEFIRDLNVRNLTLKMLNDEIKKFINYYNNERIQSNLNWKTPKQFAMMS